MMKGARSADEVSVSEIRDFFCCPYMWWFRELPLDLLNRERLQCLKQEPGMGRTKTMPFEVAKTGIVWLFLIACAGTALVAWGMFWIFRHESLSLLIYSVNLIGTVVTGFSIYFIVRWFRWRRRTPAYDRPIPGDVLFRDDDEMERTVIHAPRYGIFGSLNSVLRQGKKLATMESRSVVTPKSFSEPDRMQAVAQALLAEARFGARPGYAYVVYPDRTFDVRVDSAEVERLLSAVRTMRIALQTGRMPQATPAWHLCPACPISDCPAREKKQAADGSWETQEGRGQWKLKS